MRTSTKTWVQVILPTFFEYVWASYWLTKLSEQQIGGLEIFKKSPPIPLNSCFSMCVLKYVWLYRGLSDGASLFLFFQISLSIYIIYPHSYISPLYFFSPPYYHIIKIASVKISPLFFWTIVTILLLKVYN